MKKPAAHSQQPAAFPATNRRANWLPATGYRLQAGFTLVELMVSVGLFAVIMLISVSTLLSLVSANRKAHALEGVMNNLNISLDSMVRAVRMGSAYNCNSSSVPSGSSDCASGGSSFSFAPYGSDAAVQGTRWVYTFSGGRLYRSEAGGGSPVAVTAPEVSISDMKFYVIGTTRRDTIQPKVVIVVKGTAGADAKTQTTFYIQATAVQRSLDL